MEKQLSVGKTVLYKNKDCERIGIVRKHYENAEYDYKVTTFSTSFKRDIFVEGFQVTRYKPTLAEVLPFVTKGYFEQGTVLEVVSDLGLKWTMVVKRVLSDYGLVNADDQTRVSFEAGALKLNSYVTSIKESRNIPKLRAAKELSALTGEIILIID